VIDGERYLKNKEKREVSGERQTGEEGREKRKNEGRELTLR